MSIGRIFMLAVGGAVVLMAALTAHQAVSITQTASAAEAVAETRGALASGTDGHPSPFRTPPEQCFDVPLPEAAACRALEGIQVSPSGSTRRSPPNECFDVPLREICDAQPAERSQDERGQDERLHRDAAAQGKDAGTQA
jgi:hypothetical protein